MVANGISLIRVTTDDCSYQLWAAATSPELAVDLVLDAIPEGWCARLLEDAIESWMQPTLSVMSPGDVCELISAKAKAI